MKDFSQDFLFPFSQSSSTSLIPYLQLEIYVWDISYKLVVTGRWLVTAGLTYFKVYFNVGWEIGVPINWEEKGIRSDIQSETIIFRYLFNDKLVKVNSSHMQTLYWRLI